MAEKDHATRRKAVPPPPPPEPPPSNSFPTAAAGLGMIVLTNYQEEVKNVLSLITKALT